MTELSSIFFQIFVFNIFFLFPFNLNNIKYYLNEDQPSIFDVFLLNILIYSVVLLICSFFNFNLIFIFIFFTILSIVSTIHNFKVYYNYFLKKNNSKIFIFFLCCFLGLSLSIAANPLLSWDGIAHWYYKALNYNQGEKFENLKNLYFSYYPHLGSYIWNFFWINNYTNFEYLGRFFFIFLFLVSIFSAIDKLSIKIKLYLKLIITLILIIVINDIFLLGGYQEYFIFYLFYCFSLIILKINNSNSKKLVMNLLLLSATFLMFWIKQEGFFYTLILSFVILLFLKINFRVKLFYLTLLALLLFTSIQIKIYFHGSFSFNEAILHSGLLKYLDPLIFIKSIYLITLEILKAFIKYPIWVLISLILFLDLKDKKLFNIYSFFFIIFIGFVYAIYLQTSMDMTQLMPLTLDRIVFQGSGFYLLYIMNFFNKNLVKNNF